MKRVLLVMLVVALAWFIVAAWTGQVKAAPISEAPVAVESMITPEACGGVMGFNLLENYSFEGDYTDYVPPGGHPDCPTGICDTADTPHGWTPWWEPHPPDDPSWYYVYMPEFKAATLGIPGPVRVRSGEKAQQYFSVWRTHYAGVYQQVAVSPGASYCFSAYGHSWSADDDEDYLAGPFHGNLWQRVGIDPTGGTDWQSPNIVWGEQRQQYDEFGLFRVTAQALSNTITVFIYSHPEVPVKHNDVYWDDAQLALLVEESYTVAVMVAQGESARGGLPIFWPGKPDVLWTATLVTSTLPISLTTSGYPGDYLAIEVDASTAMTGTYTTTVTLSSSDPEAGEAPSITIWVMVVPEIYYQLLPIVLDRPQ